MKEIDSNACWNWIFDHQISALQPSNGFRFEIVTFFPKEIFIVCIDSVTVTFAIMWAISFHFTFRSRIENWKYRKEKLSNWICLMQNRSLNKFCTFVELMKLIEFEMLTRIFLNILVKNWCISLPIVNHFTVTARSRIWMRKKNVLPVIHFAIT